MLPPSVPSTLLQLQENRRLLFNTAKSKMNPKVSIIIVHLKDGKILRDCIISLNEIIYPNFEIIIVHNGSKNEVLNSQLDPVKKNISRLINTGKNIGFAKANNIGIKTALQNDADYVLLLNDDTIVSPLFLNYLIDAATDNPKFGMLGPIIYEFEQPNKIWFAGATFNKKTCRIINRDVNEIQSDLVGKKYISSDFITGCSLLVSRKTIDMIGLLDERYFLYWEDVDWGLRLSDAGLKIAVIYASKIWHKISSSSGGNDSPLKIYHKTRSHLLFSQLHCPKAKASILVDLYIGILWLILKSSYPNRFMRARAFFSAIKDSYLKKKNKGPKWLWTQ